MVWAGEDLLVPHVDELRYDPNLSLGEVVEAALLNFPRTRLADAYQERARAWDRRSGGILAGPVMLGASYNGDQVGDDSGNWGIDTELTFMIWKWGQKQAASQVAEQATRFAGQYHRALALQVAGLVREALWDLKKKHSDYEILRKVYRFSDQLTEAVRKRVESGDLPRTDLLLAETDLLKHRAEALSAEAEWMHARRRYLNLTRLNKAPEAFEETLSDINAINADHPLLTAVSAKIEELTALVRWSRYESDTGNQQIYFTIGSFHQHAQKGGPTTHGLSASLTIPFGGGGYQAPNVAEHSVSLAEAEVERGELKRRLERDLHEAEHNLQVDRVQLEAAETRRQLARRNLDLAHQAFRAGEMSLIDLLKLQVMTQTAIRDARRWQIQVKHDVARYNQAVGVLP